MANVPKNEPRYVVLKACDEKGRVVGGAVVDFDALVVVLQQQGGKGTVCVYDGQCFPEVLQRCVETIRKERGL